MNDAWVVAAALAATAVLLAMAPIDERRPGRRLWLAGWARGTLVSVFRVFLAGLIFVAAFLLGGFADRMSPLALFATGLALMFAVSFVLPHYFYRGEPLLPDRKQRRRQSG